MVRDVSSVDEDDAIVTTGTSVIEDVDSCWDSCALWCCRQVNIV